jgi:hypothetical protein
MAVELQIVARSLGAEPEATRAVALRLAGERLVVRSERPAAPGTRLSARLADGRELRLKVERCVRREAEFELDTRMVDPPAALRRSLVAALSDDGGASPRARGASDS